VTAVIDKTTLMGPDEVLYHLERLGVRHKLHHGSFVTSASPHLSEMPRLRKSIDEHADALAELLEKRTKDICAQCNEPIGHGAQRTRAWSTETGARMNFHPACYQARHEQNPYLPQPEIFIDESGYTVVIEDSGLCCFCTMQESELPEEAPMLCRRCWKKQDAKKERDRAVAA